MIIEWLQLLLFFLSFLACVAIAEELNYSISQTDPKKMIHVGGFRLQPDGSLTDKKVWFSVNCSQPMMHPVLKQTSFSDWHFSACKATREWCQSCWNI